MEPISFTLAAVLASLPANGGAVTKPTLTTHISPAIAGQWEIDLDSGITMTKEAAARQLSPAAIVSNEPAVRNGTDGNVSVLEQNEQRIVVRKPPVFKGAVSAMDINQCREVYNFGADNEMWAVSGDEWTYGRYLVTHREEGLPIIAIKTIYDNNAVDCSGNQVDQTDSALIAFLSYDNNEMQWCADPDGTECFMNFTRVLP